MSSVRERDFVSAGESRAVTLVDGDVHPLITQAQLKSRLPHKWRQHLETFGVRTPSLNELYPRVMHGGLRVDAWPEGPDALAGNDPQLTRRQLLDEYGVDFAVLNNVDLSFSRELPGLGHALARSINEWLWEEWLEFDPRFLGAIVVPVESPEVAVLEIERCAASRRWVQVILPTTTSEPLGSQKYRPIFRAAAAHGLPVAMHLGGYDPHRGTGWPSYYLEEHAAYGTAMAAQLLNMVCEGLFSDVPDLKVVLSECGVTWKVSLDWSFDNAWSLLRDEVPYLDRKPSEIIHDHVWFTTQPIEEPDKESEFLEAIAQGRLADRLLFATDYPHWDFDSPLLALPRSLEAEVRSRIMAGNACELWGLPTTRETHQG